VHLQGEEALTDYAFLSPNSLHSFCGTCGVSVLVKTIGEGEDEMPVNVRTFNGIDIESLTLIKFDGKNRDPQYVV
jgi:hypothetical protein